MNREQAQPQDAAAPGTGVQAPMESGSPAEPEFEFFAGAGRGAALEQLLHFGCFSNALLLLLGEPGSGRTTIKQQLLLELDDSWRICELEGIALSSMFELVAGIAAGFGVVATAEDEDPIAQLREALAQGLPLAGAGERILLLDDAHLLSDQLLAAVIGLVTPPEGEDSPCHVVMFGDPDLSARVQMLSDGQCLCHVIRLSPLSLKDVGDYLRLRYGDGRQVDLDLSHAQLDDLWRRSEGNPLALNKLGAVLLPAIDLELEESPPRSAGLPVTHMIGVVALLTLLLMAYLYRDSSSEQLPDSGAGEQLAPLTGADQWSANGVPAAIPAPGQTAEEPAIAAGRDAVPVGTKETSGADSGVDNGAATAALREGSTASKTKVAVSGPLVQNLQDKVVARSEVTSAEPAVTEANKPAAKKPASPPVTAPSPTVSSSTASRPLATSPVGSSQSASNQAASGQTATRPASPAEAASTARPPVKPAPNGLSADERQLLALPADYYLLQVLAAASQRSVTEFVARQSNRDQLRVYTTTRAGAKWYVVVTGGYATVQEARRQLKLLPDEQQKLGPWPRKVTEIQAGIRQFRGI